GKARLQANRLPQVSLGLAPLIQSALRDRKVQVRPGVGMSGFRIEVNCLFKIYSSEPVLALPVITTGAIVIKLSNIPRELSPFLQPKNRRVVMLSVKIQPPEPVGIKRIA